MLQGYDELRAHLSESEAGSASKGISLVETDETRLLALQSWHGWREVGELAFPPTVSARAPVKPASLVRRALSSF